MIFLHLCNSIMRKHQIHTNWGPFYKRTALYSLNFKDLRVQDRQRNYSDWRRLRRQEIMAWCGSELQSFCYKVHYRALENLDWNLRIRLQYINVNSLILLFRLELCRGTSLFEETLTKIFRSDGGNQISNFLSNGVGEKRSWYFTCNFSQNLRWSHI